VLDAPLWLTGDAWPAWLVVKRQQSDVGQEVLYGRAFFSSQFNLYKRTAMARKRPRIVIIGSSRVMQLRAFMFAPLDESFFNAGGMISSGKELCSFAELLIKERLPKPEVLIVGIDPWWLKSAPQLTSSSRESIDITLNPVAQVVAMRSMLRSRDVWHALKRGPLTPYDGELGIGTLARLKGSGFRRDGSYQVTPSVVAFERCPPYEDRETPPVIERVRNCTHQFSVPAAVDGKLTREIIEALMLLRTAGVEVYAFLPPFSSEVYRELENKPALEEWWSYYSRYFPADLQQHHISVVKACRASDMGLDDRFMLDGFHPSEVYMGHVVLAIVRQAPEGSVLKHVDLDCLSKRIEQAYSPLVFDRPRPR